MTSSNTPSARAVAAPVAAPLQQQNKHQNHQQSSTKQQDEQRCDICQMKSNFKRMTLLRCRKCQIHVHRECYDGISDDFDPDFICWACQSIGKRIKGRLRQQNKKTYRTTEILQTERPTECCLCSARGIHAMHPLFDHFGRRGRQMILPSHHDQPERLAWVHSLCAFTVCFLPGTAGCVYGCNRLGQFQSSNGTFTDQDSSEDDALSVNSDIVREQRHHSDDDLGRIVRFVYCLPTVHGTPNQWTKRITEYQKLKCTICGFLDTSKSLRIPIQCRANEDNEYVEFQGCHEEMQPDESCTQSLHVGCARWGTTDLDRPTLKRVYYYPGSQDARFPEPVVEVYCNAHAQDLVKANAANKKSKSNRDQNRSQQQQQQQQQLRSIPQAVDRSHELDMAAAARRTKVRPRKPPTPILPPTENASSLTRKAPRVDDDRPHPHAQRARDTSNSIKSPAETKKIASSVNYIRAAPTSNSSHGSAASHHSPTSPSRRMVQVAGGDGTRVVGVSGALPSLPDLSAKPASEATKIARLQLFHPPAKLAGTAAATNQQRRSSVTEPPTPRRSSLESNNKAANRQSDSTSRFTSPKQGRSTVGAPSLSQATLPHLGALSRTSSAENNSNNNNHSAPPLLTQWSGQQQQSRKNKRSLTALLPRDEAVPIGRKFGKKGKKSPSSSASTPSIRRDDYYGPVSTDSQSEPTQSTKDVSQSNSNSAHSSAFARTAKNPMLIGRLALQEDANESATVQYTDETPGEDSLSPNENEESPLQDFESVVEADMNSVRKRKKSHFARSTSTDRNNASVHTLGDGTTSGLQRASDNSDLQNYSDEQSDIQMTDGPSPGTWDHLIVGPHYTGCFSFGDWDTYVERV